MGVVVVVWLLTLAVAAGVAQRLVLLAAAVGAALFAGILRQPRYQTFVFVALACACGVHGWWASARLAGDRAVFEHAAASSGAALVALDGVVAAFPQAGAHGASFAFETRLDGRRVRLQIRAARFDVAYGDRYRMRARLLGSSPQSRRFLESRGLAGVARARNGDIELIGHGGSLLLREVFWPLHRFLRTRLSRALGGEAGLAIGMLLGERSQIDEHVRDAVRRLGITHLLAISGMHLTTLAACVVLLTSPWPRWRALVLLFSLTLYTATVGGVESLTRAYWMALILLVAHATVRPLRPIDALGKALFIMAIASPVSLSSVGLQLSFAATFAVLCCLPPRRRRRESHGAGRAHRALRAMLRPVGTAFLLSIAVELFIAPLQLHHFGVLSAVGPVATVVFLAPVTLVLLCAAPVAAVMALLPAQEWAGAALASLSGHTEHLIVACGRLAPAPITVPEPTPWLYYGGLLLGWRYRRHRAAWAGAALLVASSFLV